MLLSDFDRPPAKIKGNAFRRDVFHASLMACALIGAIASGLHFATRSESIIRQGEFVFGAQTRVGAITFVPFAGDICRQAGFDNDSGIIVPLDDASCMQVLGLQDLRAKADTEANRFETISQKFRK